jgi:cytochrome P450
VTQSRIAPGPSALPLLGNLLDMVGDPLQNYIDLWQTYQDVVRFKLGPKECFLIVQPEDVHHVLVRNQRNYIKGMGYDGFRLLVGNGLVTSEGETWRRQRRLMQPSFTPRSIGQFYQMMVEITESLVARWQILAENKTTIRVDDEMSQLTMSVIGQAMFGIDLGSESLSGQLERVRTAFQEAFFYIPERSLGLSLPLALPLPSHQRFKRNLAILDEFVTERIAEGRRALAAGDAESQTLLSLLLQARDEESGETMSSAQLRDEVITLFFAGFETTARSLTWGWYQLTRNPHVQQQLEAEVDRVLSKRPPTVEDLHELTYTRMVVDEVLRVYTPTALLARQNVDEDEIGGYTIPAGSLVVMMPYCTHRDPTIWPDPEVFDPERFRPEAIEERPKHAYIPFASGPRICLGNNFALMEMVLAYSMLTTRFRLEPLSDHPIGVEYRGTTQPDRPLDAKIRLR